VSGQLAFTPVPVAVIVVAELAAAAGRQRGALRPRVVPACPFPVLVQAHAVAALDAAGVTGRDVRVGWRLGADQAHGLALAARHAVKGLRPGGDLTGEAAASPVEVQQVGAGVGAAAGARHLHPAVARGDDLLVADVVQEAGGHGAFRGE
jgi:hypothetical protein